MKTQPRQNRFSRGYFLVEALIYIGVLTVIVSLASAAFVRALNTSRDLTKNADDIARALKAGEQWRADVRLAIAPPEKFVDPDAQSAQALEITRPDATVAYIFDGLSVWRKEGDEAARLFLAGVKSSRMFKDERAHVVSWRWEIELASKKKIVRIRPLFSFQAVAASAAPK